MIAGSLCTGIGGLDLAAAEVFGTELAWCSEIDPHADRVLERRFFGVLNVGDFREYYRLDWPAGLEVTCCRGRFCSAWCGSLVKR